MFGRPEFGGLYGRYSVFGLFCGPLGESLLIVRGLLDFGGVNGRYSLFDFPDEELAPGLLEFGGVNGRNPLSCGFGLVLPVGRFALLLFAGVKGRLPLTAGPRASFGDMAGG